MAPRTTEARTGCSVQKHRQETGEAWAQQKEGHRQCGLLPGARAPGTAKAPRPLALQGEEGAASSGMMSARCVCVCACCPPVPGSPEGRGGGEAEMEGEQRAAPHAERGTRNGIKPTQEGTASARQGQWQCQTEQKRFLPLSFSRLSGSEALCLSVRDGS
jgi:hypothetical protein